MSPPPPPCMRMHAAACRVALIPRPNAARCMPACVAHTELAFLQLTVGVSSDEDLVGDERLAAAVGRNTHVHDQTLGCHVEVLGIASNHYGLDIDVGACKRWQGFRLRALLAGVACTKRAVQRTVCKAWHRDLRSSAGACKDMEGCEKRAYLSSAAGGSSACRSKTPPTLRM